MSRAALDKDSDWDDDRWAAEVDVTRHYHDPNIGKQVFRGTNQRLNKDEGAMGSPMGACDLGWSKAVGAARAERHQQPEEPGTESPWQQQLSSTHEVVPVPTPVEAMASRPNRLTDGALRSERPPTALASTDVDVDFTTRRNRPLLSPTGHSPQVMNNSEAVGVSLAPNVGPPSDPSSFQSGSSHALMTERGVLRPVSLSYRQTTEQHATDPEVTFRPERRAPAFLHSRGRMAEQTASSRSHHGETLSVVDVEPSDRVGSDTDGTLPIGRNQGQD